MPVWSWTVESKGGRALYMLAMSWTPPPAEAEADDGPPSEAVVDQMEILGLSPWTASALILPMS